MAKLLLLACFALVACTQTYHPEYHPVTVTTVHQGGAAPPGPLVIQDPALADPNAFFIAR
jgi:hypothetical protein